ncbi:MAG: 3'-5' exonuclease [Candidatus Altiarchaeales archaeon WOR_SM1_86-2]|nr:MAG: 3'-5' exonuclease [Candidatus Altiarchaeales archaeon WOR_SM1_86-2]ODS41460.1 MAG: 3'-5' exonuclease [Candidatus Altiarchaeales archaeon WOR_SM1_79]
MHFIIVDLEATCSKNGKLSPQEIIEIGAVKIDGNGDIINTFNEFVKPKINPVLGKYCKDLTGIKQSQVDGAEGFSEVIEKFKKWIGGKYLLCSWGYYDKKQFISDCKLHDIDGTWAEKHTSIKHEYAKINNCKPCGMAKALKREGIKLEGVHHRGIDDAKNIAKIFIKYMDTFIQNRENET